MSQNGRTLLGRRSPDAYDFCVTVTSAVLLVVLAALAALVLGLVVGGGVMPRLAERNRRIAAQQAGLTVSQMLQRIVALAPTGVAVVDNHRDVVFMNSRAQELGLVRDRLLDERAWSAARRVLGGGEDVDIDLSPSLSPSARWGLSGGGAAGVVGP